MPTYDYKCPDCGTSTELFLKLAEYEKNPTPPCDRCGTPMEQTFGRSAHVDSFPEITTNHLKHITGGPVTFNSLHEIRKFEKQHEDRGLIWELGSFDNKEYGQDL